MRLVSLTVRNFAGIRQAALEFEPGLNVFHGPNELGKSTLVDAVRAVLLTPYSSAVHEKWRSWHDDASPEVELVLESEPQRFWRARKTFASAGRASLDESSDGVSFHNLASQRAVDHELRRLLCWGLREPGGRGGPRGMPETFLSSVLLPLQAEATKVFQRTLQQDDDESARTMLKQALETLAADPILADAIKQSQARVDEAFTAKGRKRTGKNSPFAHASEKVRDLERQLERCRKQHETSQHLREAMGQQVAERDTLKDRVGLLKQQLDRARRLETARTQFDQLLAERDKIQQQQALHDQLSQQLAELDEQQQQARQQQDRAEAARKAALAELEAARAEHSPEKRMRMQAEAQAELAEAKRELAELQTRLRQAESLAKQLANVALAEAELAAAQEKHQALTQQHRQAVQRAELLDAQRRLAELNVCEAECQRLRAEVRQCRQAADDLQRLSQQQQALAAQQNSAEAPAAEQLRAIRELSRELELARAKLSAGLTIEVEPAGQLELEVATDDEAAESMVLDRAREFDAQRKAALRVKDLGAIRIQAGDKQQQQALANLEKRWAADVQPVLERCGAETLQQLEALAESAGAMGAQAAELARQLETAGANASRLDEQTELLVQAETRLTDRSARWQSLPPQIRSDAEQRQPSSSQPAADLDGALEEARKQLQSVQNQLGLSETDTRVAEERLAAARQLAESTQSEAERQGIGSVETCQASVEAVQTRLEQQEAKAATLAEDEPAEVVAATKARQSAEADVQQAVEQAARFNQQWRELRDQRQTAGGVLQNMQAGFSQAAFDEAQAEVRKLETELSAAGDPSRSAAQWESALDEAQAALTEVSHRLRDTELTLNAQGGPALDEQIETLSEAVAQAQADEQALIDDYEAWRLLNEVLKEVERTESSNLGSALAPELSRLLSELTGGVHDGVDLGADLELLGIRSIGARHQLEALSTGMRDQFATLLRVHLAAELGHFVVLDDQLVQSDPERMGWLCRFLQNRADKCQIAIFTCRPEDYVFNGSCQMRDLRGVVEPY